MFTRRSISILMIALLLCVPLFSQNTFFKTYGNSNYNDVGYSVLQTSDNNYIIAGVSKDNVYLVKADHQGDTLWTKMYGGDGVDVAYSIIEMNSQNLLLSGYSTARGGLWIICTNTNGDSLWTKVYNLGSGKSICKTTDGGFVITGTSPDPGYAHIDPPLGADTYLLKIDSIGNIDWVKTYDKGGNEEGLCVHQTTDNGFIISATTDYQTSSDIWLIKTKMNGDTLWTKIYSNSNWRESGNSICQTNDGGFFVTGMKTIQSSPGSDLDVNGWLIKTNAIGDTLWTRTIIRSCFDNFYSGMQTQDGGYVVAGSSSWGCTNDNIYIVKLNSNGEIQWENQIGNMDNYLIRAYDLKETSDNGFIITGIKWHLDSDIDDLCLVKTDSLGQILSSSIENDDFSIVSDFALSQNFPNPFNGSTTINYTLHRNDHIKITLYNIAGNKVASLVDAQQNVGTYDLSFDSKGLPSGIYLYSLQAGNSVQMKKMILLK
ncbi:MAG: T9SS type A sorting domain-containing protein, partial [Candidatus Marinimicrobia bacterium]|nr:T9SS type A sorting domain-containing protein [Candidatus Neomarinimicrobiota bacterium]